MQAFVADESSNFVSIPIGTGPYFTIIAGLELPPGSWVAFASVALAGGSGGTTVEAVWLLDGNLLTTGIQGTVVASPNTFLTLPMSTGVALDRPAVLQVACQATQPGVASQPTTISAIQVESVNRLRDQFLGPGGPATGEGDH